MAPKQNPNKLLIMLPLLFLMNKIDFDNGNILTLARISFCAVQIFQLLMVFLIRSKIINANDQTKIIVPDSTPPNPFAQEPQTKPDTKSTYFEFESTKVQEFMTQSMIGAAISSFIHFKFGVNQVVVIQSIMVPMNVYENPLFQKYILGKKDRIWDERLEGESEAPVPAGKKALASADAREAIVSTWDAAATADFDGLFELVRKTPNIKSKADGWTALMIACGSPVDTDSFIKKLLKAGADPTLQDNDGWTALHWASFHGRPEAVEILSKEVSKSVFSKLMNKADKEDKTPLDLAKAEDNKDVVSLLETCSAAPEATSEETSGLRQRKPADAEATAITDVD